MGIFAGGKSARASGGTVSTVGQYVVHAFTTTGANTFTPATTGFIDILLVGGGGGAGAGAPSGGGGAGATLFKKMIPVIASTPYPISIGAGGPSAPSAPGTPTTFIYSGITTTASGGGFGGPDSIPGAGGNVPTASGGGTGRYGPNATVFPSPGGTGAGVLGIGFPGGASGPGAPYTSGGGGGAGGAGGAGGGGGVEGSGGPGVPIAYFTGISTSVSFGGRGGGQPPSTLPSNASSYGSGGPSSNGSPENGRPGVAYIRYI